MIMRCKYSKIGEIAFISHLDLLRIFIRALRRESIRLNYSQGFHPHPKLSFSPALGIGVESLCELVDIDIAEEISPKEFAVRLNDSLPSGLEITECTVIQKLGGMSRLSTHSEYEISLQNPDADLEIAVEKVRSSESILIQKKNKKGKIADLEVRGRIAEISVTNGKINAILLNSMEGALKPYELLSIVNSMASGEYLPTQVLKKRNYYFDGKELSVVQ